MSAWLDDLTELSATQPLTRRRVLGIAIQTAAATLLPFADDDRAVAQVVVTGDCPHQAGNVPCAGNRTGWYSQCSHPVPKAGYINTFNGCGPEGKVIAHFIPDSPLYADFQPGCNAHDCCYGTCGRDKAKCDADFSLKLQTACAEKFGLPGLAGGVMASACSGVAQTYYKKVAQSGDDAFNSAQAKGCDCCECAGGCQTCEYCSSEVPNGVCKDKCEAPQRCCNSACVGPCPAGETLDPTTCACVCASGHLRSADGNCQPQKAYCACDGSCWDDAESCLAHCKASLRCFTGICGPAEPGQCG